MTRDGMRAAVIGVGAMGRNHARLYADMEDVTLVGVADLDLVARERVAGRYGTRGFSDYRELLEAGRPDIVSLAVPTQWHYPIARDLIERGIHVLVEKPVAQTVEEGETLVDQARTHGVSLAVGHVERFNPALLTLKEHLDWGELGRIFQISVRRISGFPPRVKDVGVVLDLATHDLDVMRHLTNAEVTHVSAEIARELNRPREDMLCGLLRFDNGVVGMLNVSWLSPTKIRELMISGERGMFVVNYLTQDLYFYENGFNGGDWESLQVFRGMAEGRTIRYPVVRREPLRAELESFVRSVRNGDTFPVTGEDGVQALVLAKCLVQAGEQGKTLYLNGSGAETGRDGSWAVLTESSGGPIGSVQVATMGHKRPGTAKEQAVPILDLKGQYRSIQSEIDAAISEVLGSSQFILGPAVKDLEQRVAAYCGCEYGVGVASGTDALRLTLAAIGVGPGDEVITTPFTFIATANTISRSGATPVFVDIDPTTYNIEPEALGRAITQRTKAIIPVHLYGQPAAMDPIMELAEAHDLFVLEDAAQAIGARYKGRPVGCIGHAGCLSFYPTKNLGGYGDGGMVVTNDAALAERIDVLRQQGSRKKYHAETLGFNSRLDSLQAAIVGVKLDHLGEWNQARRQMAARYGELLCDLPVVAPYESPEVYHVYHQYTIRAPQRDALAAYLKEHGIRTMIYYPVPLHLQELYDGLGYQRGSLPVSETSSREVLCLPIYPELRGDQQIMVAKTLREFYSR